MSPPDFTRRSTEPELMDDLTCRGQVVGQTLHELDVINQWLGGNAVTFAGVKRLLRDGKPHEGILKLADLGCGSGDFLRRLARYGRAKNIKMELTGIDANPHIIAYARNHSSNYPEIEYSVQNVLSPEFSTRRFDVITGTLFFHHFDDATLASLLRQLVRQSNRGVLINDIHRHPLAYHSIRLLTRFFSASSMVKYDAPLSVRRAFTRADWVKLLGEAGVKEYRIFWKWAFRWQILIPAHGF